MTSNTDAPGPEEPGSEHKDWPGRLARAMGEEPLAPAEIGTVLRLAREVAHRAERRLAPISTYLAGVRAGRAAALGRGRAQGLDEAAGAALDLLPPGGDDPSAGTA